MSVFVEFHVLQNFAPSLLNRDDTGAHKDAMFGGVRRARISSQCLKRAIREHWRNGGALPTDQQAVRSKRIYEQLAQRLAEKGRDGTEALAKSYAALGGLGLQADDDGKSQYLLFLGADEIDGLANAIDRHWADLPDAAGDDAGKTKAKDRKKAAKETCPPELVKAMKSALSGTRSLEVRLFGRMLADKPDLNADACCQVAHAIGTSALEREFDFYTAVDDLAPTDNSGADMIGQVEFASSCFYRYAVIDLGALHNELGNSVEVTRGSLRLFARAMVEAVPAGKQNSFAAHQPPAHIGIAVRKNAAPRSFANAFERPIQVGRKDALGLSGQSALALEQYRARLDASYGSSGRHWFHDLTGADLPGNCINVEAVFEESLSHAIAALD